MSKQTMAKPVVLIFKETLLPVSETFIETPTRNLSEFRPRYVGLGRVSPSLAIPPDAIVLTTGMSVGAGLVQKAYRRAGIAPNFHRKTAEANAQLIHAHFASGGRSALPVARHLGIPLVVTLHGSDVTTRIDFKQRYRDLWREACTFVCVSDFIRQKAAEAGFPNEKLKTLYIGIDCDTFQPKEEARQQDVVLFVGRLVEKKGCGFLLRAMAEVGKTHPNVRTVVIGDGPMRASLQDLASELNVSCQFLGAQPKAVVQEWMAKARVFCAPSITASDGDSEGFGMVFAEAQAMGTPVVSFQHGGIPEVVLHGRTGLLAPEGDANALAGHIETLLDDEEFWTHCSQEGIAWVRKRFDLKVQIRQLEKLYADVCRATAESGCVLLEGCARSTATRS